MEKIINLKNITGKNSIKFLCEDIHADFSRRTTRVLVYFNNLNISHYDLHAELLISDNKQLPTNAFDLHIPSGVNSATVIVSTNKTGHKLDAINVQAI